MKRLMNNRCTAVYKYVVVILLSGLVLTACADKRQTWTKSKNGYVLAIRTNPEPMQVGETAEISAVLHRQQRPVDCSIRFRQYMPGMAMAGDDEYHRMRQELSSGIYVGESGEFSMGGDWLIEFDIACDEDTLTISFPFHVPWPEGSR